MQSRITAVKPLALCIALGLSPALAQAQDNATELDEVIVTGTRMELSLEDGLLPVEVIDRAAIERSQARSLPDLLKGRAGINIGNQGGMGKLTSVFIRGTEADHVLVLVDGVRIGSATAGLAMFQDIPVDQIERIEIVRGPRSSLYGSEAIGGVIQIFTRTGGEGFQRNLRLGGGSNNLREASAGFSNRGERGWIGAEAAYQQTDGINACNGSATLFQGCFVDEPDLDGYRNVSVSLRGGFHLSDSLTVQGQFLNADARNEFDGSIWSGNEAENTQRVFASRLDWKASERLSITAQAGRAHDKSDNYFADESTGTRSFVSTFDTRRDTASAQADFTVAEGQRVAVGGDWQRDVVESTTAFDVSDRDNSAGFVEYLGSFGAHNVQASLRYDDNEQFGGHTTGGLGWGMRLGNDFNINASYATGFRAPSFNDLYFPYSGNPNLLPEASESLNLGVSQARGRWHWSLNAYETRIDDLIALDSVWMPGNIEEARIRGAEATFGTEIAGWELSTQLSHTDPRNRSAGPNHGNLLPRRARNTGRIDVDRAFGAFRFGTTVNGASHRFDNAANTLRLSGYGTVDLRLEYALHRDWTLQARATNVFDRDYETVAWYNQPGREYGVSLRYQAAD